MIEADANDEVHAGDAGMLFEKGHEMWLAVAHKEGKFFNGEVLIVMLVDVVDDFANFGIFSVDIVGDFFMDMAVQKEEIDKLMQFCFEEEFIVPPFFSGKGKNHLEAGFQFGVACHIRLNARDKFLAAIL